MTKFTKANWMTRALQEKLSVVGEQFRLARLRRDLTMDQVAQRAQCTRLTILHLAKDDELGHMIQDLGIKNKKRASKR